MSGEIEILKLQEDIFGSPQTMLFALLVNGTEQPDPPVFCGCLFISILCRVSLLLHRLLSLSRCAVASFVASIGRQQWYVRAVVRSADPRDTRNIGEP